MKIKELKAGDSFRTKNGKNIYKIVDVVKSEKLNSEVWLLKGGWYVSNPDKEVVI